MFGSLTRARLLFLICILAFLTCSTIASAQSVPVSGATVSNQWLVELTGPPVSDGGTLANVQQAQAAFRTAAAAAGIPYTERKAYNNLFDGFAITATRSAAAAMGTLKGVKAVYPDSVIALDPRSGTAEPDLFWAIQMTGADLVQNDLGITGNGVKVAVIDTGIDYNHPDLGGCFGPGCRVAKGYDLVGDAYNADTNPVPVPDPDPMDCAGHGTHVSGIIGASGDPLTGGVRGVAPGVTFYAYRVFGCVGTTSDSVMIDAMERALNDGAQVVNMSIGAAFGWPQWPTAMASDRLVKRGVVVVTSFGNSGANGLYSGGAPGLGSLVIGVASFDNTHVWEQYFTATPDDAKFGFLPASGAPAPFTAGTYTVAAVGTPTTTNAGCSALPAGSLTGKIALIRRGTCTFNTKAFNAQNAGAAGVILFNNTSGFLNPTVAGPPAITIPVVAITAADGLTLYNRIAGGLNITFTANFDYFFNPFTGGLISSFSSYGLSPDLTFKPDIGAPGGNIRSTYPLALGGYAVLSGTSMASPHVAGAVALLLESNPKLQSRKVRDILENTAVPKNWWGNPALGFLDNAFRQGAGLLNIYDAITATTRITPGKLALGESQSGPVTATLTVDNNDVNDVTYNLSFVPGLISANTFSPAFYLSDENVSFSANTITVPAGGEVAVNATITAPTGPDHGLYGGWIVFTPAGSDGATLRVPYGGFIGDYQSINPLTSGGYGFPWLARIVGSSYVQQSDGAVFTMTGGDNVYVLLHVDQQFQQLQMQVLDPITGRNYQYIDNEKYLPRSSTATSFFAFAWNGITFTPSGKKPFVVPNGSYVISVRALKALGNPLNPADWQTWTSPVFTIARP